MSTDICCCHPSVTPVRRFCRTFQIGVDWSGIRRFLTLSTTTVLVRIASHALSLIVLGCSCFSSQPTYPCARTSARSASVGPNPARRRRWRDQSLLRYGVELTNAVGLTTLTPAVADCAAFALAASAAAFLAAAMSCRWR